jgi:putative membrane protein
MRASIGTAFAARSPASCNPNSNGATMKTAAMILLCSLPLVAFAADSPDESFYKKAAEAGMAEVDAGHMAQEKGSSQAVKDFAAMMVKDHTAANNKLMKIAAAKNIELPNGPGMMNKAREKKADMKSGESFDKDYIQSQIKAHEDTVALLQKEIDTGKDADAQAFARETLPKVKMHLDKINQLATAAGVK